MNTVSLHTLNKLTARLGFIGLGLMGSRLTRRLHSSGWNVQAWNRSPAPANALRQEGIAIAPSVANLVADSDVTFLRLPTMRLFVPYISAGTAFFLRQGRESLFLR